MKNNNTYFNLSKGVKIVNLEGKDLKRGFSFLNKKNKLALYKFKGNFDFCLGLIELERLCKQKDIQLYEEINDKLFSKILICLNFNYSNKNNNNEIEKVIKNKTIVKEQYKAKKEKDITGTKGISKNEIIELRAERDNLLKQTKDATEKKKIRNEYKQQIKNNRIDRDESIKDKKLHIKENLKYDIKKLNYSLTRNGIREELYINNITIDGKIYRRFLRSSGSARIGKCIFLLEDVYEEMMEYALAGNEIVDDMELDLPSYEAYLGLINTALEDIMVIEPKNILFVDDIYSKPYIEKCMVTKLVNNKLHTDIDDYEVSNSLFDGSSLIDFSLLEKEYCVAGGIQLRNKWFKGFATGCNIQQFFIDHNITKINQLNGFTLAENIKDIKFITTESSIKYLKMNKGIEGFKKWLDIISPIWGICGHPHSSKFAGGKYVQSHYQLLNNIQLSPDEIAEIAKESKEYAELLKNDLEVFKLHIQALIQQEEELTEEEWEDQFNTIKIEDSHKFMLEMVKLNSVFANTKAFKDYRKETIDNFIENCKKGHLLIFGCYATVISNSIDYLYHAIDNNWEATKEQSHMEHKSIMCDFFYKDYDKELLCSRSPMPVQGNILIAKNVNNKEIRKYFSFNKKLSNFIMHINVIENNCYERGSSFDNDGDKFLISNNMRLLENSKENYEKFLVPVNAVQSNEKVTYFWNNISKATLDIKCSQNNIGRIINDSMILVSEYWHRINHGESHEDLLTLYKYICELSIMSNLAIDACKRPVPYKELSELIRIENCEYFRNREVIQVKIKDTWVDKNNRKHNKTYKGFNKKKKQIYQKDENNQYILKDKLAKVRPMFFKLVGEGQEYCFKDFDCSMDYLQKSIKIKTYNRNPTINLGDLFSDFTNELKTGKGQKKHIDKIIGYLENLDDKIKAIKIKKMNSFDKKDEIFKAREEVIKELQEIGKGKGITDNTLIALLKRLDKDYKKKTGGLTSIGRILLVSLYNAYKDSFIKMFKNNIQEVDQLIDDKNGDIKIFNRKYKKIKVKTKFFEKKNVV